jgi:hypothetical protein
MQGAGQCGIGVDRCVFGEGCGVWAGIDTNAGDAEAICDDQQSRIQTREPSAADRAIPTFILETVRVLTLERATTGPITIDAAAPDGDNLSHDIADTELALVLGQREPGAAARLKPAHHWAPGTIPGLSHS